MFLMLEPFTYMSKNFSTIIFDKIMMSCLDFPEKNEKF